MTVAQLPNASLAIFLVVSAVRVLTSPRGSVRTVLDAVGSVAVVWWAADEILRGVNPFRRMLGATVLAVVVIGLAR